MQHIRKTGSKELRETAIREVPALASADPKHWRLFAYLAFGVHHWGAGALLLSADILAYIEEGRAAHKSRHYSGGAFLRAWQERFTPIEYTEAYYPSGKARVLKGAGFSPALRAAIRKEQATRPSELKDRCYLASGKPYTAQRGRSERAATLKETQAVIQERLAAAGNSQVIKLTEYLNSLPPTRFTKLYNRYECPAYKVAGALADDGARAQAYNVLGALGENHKPHYAPSGKGGSVRVFPVGSGLPNLKSEVRGVFLQEYPQVDLACAQLAIVARLWAVDSVQELLQAQRDKGESPWIPLCKRFDLADTDDNKSGLKKMLYALIYGGAWGRDFDSIPTAAYYEFGEEKGGEVLALFQTDKLIDDLYRARNREKAKITKAGGGYDCFSTWIPCGKEDDGGRKAVGVLACQAQAYELLLLWPVVRRCIETKEVDIVCWLHDGCYLAFRDRVRGESILEELQGEVQAIADRLGIITRLEKKEGLTYERN